jgi:hypothetical protein
MFSALSYVSLPQMRHRRADRRARRRAVSHRGRAARQPDQEHESGVLCVQHAAARDAADRAAPADERVRLVDELMRRRSR